MTMPTRQWDWERRLHRFVAATQNVPLEWGQQDCGLWALRAIDAMCETDIAAPFIGQYSSLDGAIAMFTTRGWATVLDAAVELIGEQLPTVDYARRGDPVMIMPPESGDQTLGLTLIMGEGGAWSADVDGLRFLPIRAIRMLSHVTAVRCA